MTRALLALLVAVTLAARGGGGGGDDDQVATLGNDDAAQDDDSSSADDGDGELTEAEREDAMLEFTECMRDHGVDLPDPSSSGGDGGPVIVGGPATGANGGGGGGPSKADNEAFDEANAACESILEDAFGDRPQMSPEEQAEMQDNMLAFTECMREHGIDMPDPEFSEDGGGFSISVDEEGGGGGGPDPSDPDFEEAQEACQGELGFEGEKGGPVMRTEGGPKGGSS